jgi:GNAT superfamily N-acetyltransferase
VDAAPGGRLSNRSFTHAERPELLAAAGGQDWPASAEFARHGDTLERYGGRIFEEFPQFQFHVLDGEDVVARGRSLPLHWDGTVSGLPRGMDGVFERAFEEGDGNVLCAAAIAVRADRRGQGWSRVALDAMIALARRHGFDTLLAPVKPTAKDRYPLVPIERYAGWRREDGLLFDPWMRVHERAGGKVLQPERCSVRVTGTVAEWEEWTALAFPESGEYVIPGGLALVEIDREADSGRYWEPNVWMLHDVPPS